MNDSELAFTLQYCSPNKLLVVTQKGKLIELYCPFVVKVLSKVGSLYIGEVKTVIKVKTTSNLVLVYMIESQLYFYYHFEIIIL